MISPGCFDSHDRPGKCINAMTVRLRQLEAFSAVARFGGVTAAADALGVSQPAISRLLASFGESVGFPLFERRDGRLRPTREARYLLGEVDRMLASAERIEELMGDLSERKGGYLRIAWQLSYFILNLFIYPVVNVASSAFGRLKHDQAAMTSTFRSMAQGVLFVLAPAAMGRSTTKRATFVWGSWAGS